MRKLLPIFAAALYSTAAHATVTVTSNVSTLPGGNAPTAIVRVTIQNCASPTVWNTGQIIPATQNFPVSHGTATMTLHDNVTEVACQGNFLSYYSFSLVSGGVTTAIGDYELPPGRFNLANLAPVTTPPTSPGILQGPAGPRGPAGANGTGGTGVTPTTAGIPIWSGTTYSGAKASPTGGIVGTSDAQTLSNKTFADQVTAPSFATSGTGPGSISVSGTTPGQITLGPASGSTPAVTLANAGDGTVLVTEGTSSPARVCTATNGVCPPGTGGTSTSTAYRVGTYTSGVSGGTGNLTGSNITTDATGSDLGARNITAGTSNLTSTNCDTTAPWGATACSVLSTNAHLTGGLRTNLKSSLAQSTLFQGTGASWNSGPVLGTIHNFGWRTHIANQTYGYFLERGIKEMYGDGGFGFNCYAVGDCIHEYDYQYYDGGTNAPADESIKWKAVNLVENQGFLHGTINAINSVAGTAPYDASTQVVTFGIDATSGNHITDGTKLMDDPSNAGVVHCNFNGNPTAFDSSGIGRFPITACSGTPPAINTWGVVNAMIGDTTTNGQVTANVPVPQTFTVVLGAAQSAFSAPDGSNTWQNFICVVGTNYIENARLTAVSGNNLTANIRYPNNGPVHIFQGPACAPNQSVSIDAALTNGQQASSFWSLGTLDGGTTLLIVNQAGGGIGYSSIFRNGDVPWNNTSAFHLVNSAEIVANTAPNAISPITGQLEDNGYAPPVGRAVMDPHSNNVVSTALSIVDTTSQYGGGAGTSSLLDAFVSGPRVAGDYRGLRVVNTNDLGMYQDAGGWASNPGPVYSAVGAWGTILNTDLAPSASLINVANLRPSQTKMKLFTSGNGAIAENILAGGYAEWDFTRDGADSVRSSFYTFPKTGGTSAHLGVMSGSAPDNLDVAIGSTVDQASGQVSTVDGRLHVADLTVTGTCTGCGTGGGAGVSSLNTLTGGVTIAAGSGISVTPSGSTLTIANTASSGGAFSHFSTVPTGTINGTNLVFTVPNAPAILWLTRNGVGQEGLYTVSGTTITFNAGFAPQPGDRLYAQALY